VPTRVTCEACAGTGSEDKPSRPKPHDVQGRRKSPPATGLLLIETTCPTCNGAGKTIRTPCRSAGAGTVQRERSLQVAIPAGVEDAPASLTGEARPASGLQNGDLYVHVASAHQFFQREQANI